MRGHGIARKGSKMIYSVNDINLGDVIKRGHTIGGVYFFAEGQNVLIGDPSELIEIDVSLGVELVKSARQAVARDPNSPANGDE